MPGTRVHPDQGIRLDQGSSRPPSTDRRRSGWTWFWAAFSVVLLAGVSILFLASQPDDEIATLVADAPESQGAPAADDPQPAGDPIPGAAGQASDVLLGG